MEEYINEDKILQEMCDWNSPIDSLKDEVPFDEESYVKRAKDNIEFFKNKIKKPV
jgi:hypothetical protein